MEKFVALHKARVRRAKAMELLNIDSDRTFAKVVDANPQLAHRLPGETQDKYLTEQIFRLLHPVSVCAKRSLDPMLGREKD